MQYCCDQCDKSFEKIKSYTNHRRSHRFKKDYPTEKYCSDCKSKKSIDKFSKHWNKKANRYYPSSYCKKCTSLRSDIYRKEHPEWNKRVLKESYSKWKKRVSGEICLICGESRILDMAHIIPRKSKNRALRLKWWNQSWNILGLCPNHHRLFDNNKLTSEEYIKIKDKIIEANKIYAKIQRDNASVHF